MQSLIHHLFECSLPQSDSHFQTQKGPMFVLRCARTINALKRHRANLINLIVVCEYAKQHYAYLSLSTTIMDLHSFRSTRSVKCCLTTHGEQILAWKFLNKHFNRPFKGRAFAYLYHPVLMFITIGIFCYTAVPL